MGLVTTSHVWRVGVVESYWNLRQKGKKTVVDPVFT